MPVYVLHDFDKAGFSIVGVLRRGSRRYRRGLDVVDMGLRLNDVEKYGLESEPVTYNHDPGPNLRENGATEDEIEFLRTRRVELNADGTYPPTCYSASPVTRTSRRRCVSTAMRRPTRSIESGLRSPKVASPRAHFRAR